MSAALATSERASVPANARPLTPAARFTAHLRPAIALRRHGPLLDDQRYDGAPLCDPDQDIDPVRAAKLRGRALAVVEQLPGFASLVEVRGAFEAAADGRPASMTEIATVIGAMLDGRPNFDPSKRAGYVDMLLEVLRLEAAMERFTVPAVAAAAYRSLTTATFAPGVDELLALVRAARSEFRHAVRRVDQLLAHLDAAEAVLLVTGDIDAADASPVPFAPARTHAHA